MKIYLAGAINGCTDGEANDWRQYVMARLNADFLDPMRRDYRGVEDQNVAAIVEGDLDDINASDVILVMAERPSWGTAMETYYAHAVADKYVLVICPGRVSPWLRAHSAAVVATLDDAIAHIAAMGNPEPRASDILKTFSGPKEGDAATQQAWRHVRGIGRTLVDAIERRVPESRNKREAIAFAQRAVSLANGAFVERD